MKPTLDPKLNSILLRAICLSLLTSLPVPAMAQSPFPEIIGMSAGEHLGEVVGEPADLTGDGRPDFALGMPSRDSNKGLVVVHDGATGLRLMLSLQGNSNSYMGSSVAFLDDIDLIPDSRIDLAVGAPGKTNTSGQATGWVGVVSGSYILNGSGQQFLWQTYGPTLERFGASVCNLGDVTGDGHDDLVVGAPGFDITGKADVGRVHLVSGATGTILFTYAEIPAMQSANDQFGSCVASVPDLDGDGLRDVLVGEPLDESVSTLTNSGAVHVLSTHGAKLTLLGRVPGHDQEEHFGATLAGGKDINGDGRGDFVVGAPESDYAAHDAGRVYLYSGAAPFALIAAEACELPDAGMGFSLHFGGDVNGDGFDDFVAGLPLADLGGNNRGAIRIFSGRDHLLMKQFMGDQDNCQYGHAVVIAPNLDSLPGDDVAVGAWLWNATGKDDAGKLFLISGTPWTYSFCASKASSLTNCVPVLTSTDGKVSKSGGSTSKLMAGPVPGGAGLPGILIYTRTGMQASPLLTNFGYLCLNQFLRCGAFPAQPGGSAGTCSGSYSWDLSAIVAATGQMKIGDALYFQGWYRDPGFPFPGNANFTNGVGVIMVTP